VTDPIKYRVGPLRGNVEPVQVTKHSAVWAERDSGVVWQGGDLAANLAAVLRRRLIDATRIGGGRLPVHNATSLASDSAVSAFLTRSADDDKLEELLWGLFAVEPNKAERRVYIDDAAAPLPRGRPTGSRSTSLGGTVGRRRTR
jgi:CRISPR-associated protein Csx17